jgi:prepilin-type N-terminal cleavage/methylation domain-containing protein
MTSKIVRPRSRAVAPRGLTLIELLAVIAIIGLLAGLLLPAVQSVRESARSSSCANNMRQFAGAIESYTNQHGFLPPGGIGRPFHPSLCPTCASNSPEPSEWQARHTVSIAEACQPTWVNGAGLSWSGLLLPFVDQLAIFAKINPVVIDHGSAESWRPGTTGGEGFGSFFPAVFQCPSNPVPVRKTTGHAPGLRQSYVGISGADVDPGYRGSFDQGHNSSCGAGTWQSNLRAIQTYAWGLMSINGILIPNGRLTPGHVLDGMSNTMVVGEQSDWAIATAGGTEAGFSWAAGSQVPCRAGGQGWLWSGPPRTFGFRPVNAVTNTAVPNLTTITAGLGTRICPDARGTVLGGRTPFDGLPMPETGFPNTPIRSAHRAGAWIAFADGSVRFLAEGIETALFKNLAVRDTVRASPPPLKVLP